MPVHLGSMGESIKTVIAENSGKIRPGDVFMLNDPYNGGTHLPDVTVVTPVFMEPPASGVPLSTPRGGSGPASERPGAGPGSVEERKILFYVGSRGHHADIGGITPGSMPPFSTRIEQEGVQIDNFRLVDRGTLREAEMLALLCGGAYPARNPPQNIAEQMGMQLQNTAVSVNIKERLDFSCALFDASGNLIANAPHMPVHLGSMGESIKTVIAENSGKIRPGDVFMLNDPYNGGTHLPEIGRAHV